MTDLDETSKRLIEEIFAEERKAFIDWIRDRKGRPSFWLVIATVASFAVLLALRHSALQFALVYPQFILNCLFLSLIVATIVAPFIWPIKPGDYFSDKFKKGLSPAKWEFDGEWKADRDESGKPCLTVTNSDRGGLALPCLSWADFEVNFETRILSGYTGWVVRASSMNEYVHIKLSVEQLSRLYRVATVWIPLGAFKHGIPFKLSEWYPVRIVARSNWLTIYIVVDDKRYRILQEDILGIRPPVAVELRSDRIELPYGQNKQLLEPSFRSGSFGFRVHADNKAQFRNLRAYHLR